MEKLAVTRQELKASPKPNNIIPVLTKLDSEFFRDWVKFLHPFVKLTSKETDVMASFLKHRWELTKITSDPAVVDAMLMDKSIKSKILEDCHITKQHLYVIMNTLKRKKIIVNGIINSRLIPNVKDDGSGVFKLLILFKEKNRDDTK